MAPIWTCQWPPRFRYGTCGCCLAASLDADDLGDGVGAVGAGPGDALAPVDELVAGVPQAGALEVVGLAAQPAADEGRGAALQPAGAPAELRLEVLQERRRGFLSGLFKRGTLKLF